MTTPPTLPSGNLPPRAPVGPLRRLARMALKECRETLRDRRTIITLVLMPLLLYPLLSLVFQRYLASMFRAGAGTERYLQYDVFVASQEDYEILATYIHVANYLITERRVPADEAADVIINLQTPKTPPAPGADERQVATGQADLAVRIVRRERLAAAEVLIPLAQRMQRQHVPFKVEHLQMGITCEFLHRPQSEYSRQALAQCEARLRILNDYFVTQRLRTQEEAAVVPATSFRRAVAAAGAPAAFSVASVVPLILLLMTITGAVYPAIDLTAGERERGTLEALVAAPIPRLGVLLAKYAAVLLVAVLTASVHLTAMTVTVSSLGMTKVLFGSQGISPLMLLQVLGLLLLFAAFFSAILLAVSCLARSFKEAQAYLIPLMLLALLPGVLSLQGNLNLRGPLAVAPLINIVLLGRDLFEHKATLGGALLVVVSTVLYALAALALAARIFGTDAILYGSQGTWGELLRRPRHGAPVGSPVSAFSCLALIFPCMFITSNAVAQVQLDQMDLPQRLRWNALIAVGLFLGFPLLAAWYGRVRMTTGFALRLPPVALRALPIAGGLGLGLWPLAHELLAVMHDAGFASISPELLQRAKAMVDQFRTASPALLVFCMSLVPAITEEFLFRGYLFGALSARQRPWTAIAATALIFGVMHVVSTRLMLERFIPTAALGLVLGWIRWRTDSIWPGVALHACHNGLIVLATRYLPELASYYAGGGADAATSLHLPPLWVLGSAAVTVLGIAGLWLVTKHSQPAPESKGSHSK